MKTFFRHIVEFLLLVRAKKVLKGVEHIIGVTGSIGKTSTRMAVADVLSLQYSVQTSSHNFNTPMGLLLSVLGIEPKGNSFFSWVGFLIRVFCKKLPKPQILVLEYGIDTPGDMVGLLKIAVPDRVVMTPISIAHTDLGQFSDIHQIRAEKLKLAHASKRKVIVNGFDHETAKILRETIPQAICVFGFEGDADVIVSEARPEELGISFRVGEEYYFAPVYGQFQTQIFVPAILLGIEFGISVADIKHAIGSYKPPAGRGRILVGIHESILWDFSYNSSPTAAMAVLCSFPEIPGFSRRVMLLGNMNELGQRAQKEHERLGKVAAKMADHIFFVGKNAEDFLRGAGEKENVSVLPNAKEAGKVLCGFLRKGDILLVKGSQNEVFLEAALEMILADTDDRKLLCRQSEYWEKIRNKYFWEKT